MARKPLIGITADLIPGTAGRTRVAVYRAYVEAVRDAGGESVILPPLVEQIPLYLRLLDGLLLTGGDDLHPRHFGQRRRRVPMRLSSEERTRFELRLVREFLKTRRPVLGICLGCQTLNVALGGTLVQDLGAGRDHREGMHVIRFTHGSKLERILGKTIRVRTRHHQAVDRPAAALAATGRSSDGVIEAVEHRTHPFAVGIQWHPELQRNRALFQALIRGHTT